ncbi:MAG: DNA repair protein RecO C-terminal domain-containing protein [Desulfovibrio sp.]|nr:DNA repair protein RecO C-terminal domain-containing protein [Desulfovibrio sp.]
MREWIDYALVLRIGHFRENDLWLKLLCRKRGLLTLFAFGGSKSKRRFCGCLDVLNSLRCRVRVSGRGNFLNLEEAVLEEGPRSLRSDWQRMGLASNCLRFVEALGVNEENADVAYALVENLRSTLDADHDLPGLFPLFFRLSFSGAAGFAPNLGKCSLCGAEVVGPAQFLVDEGQLHCTNCRVSAGFSPYSVDLSASGLDLLRHVQQVLPSGWRTKDLSVADRRACARAIDGFVQYHLGLRWEEGHFRRV